MLDTALFKQIPCCCRLLRPYSTTPFLRDHLSPSLSRDAPFYGPQSLIGKYPPTDRIFLNEANPLHNPIPAKQISQHTISYSHLPACYPTKILNSCFVLWYMKHEAGVVTFGNQTVCRASAPRAEPNHLSAVPRSTKPLTAKSNEQPTHIINHIT